MLSDRPDIHLWLMRMVGAVLVVSNSIGGTVASAESGCGSGGVGLNAEQQFNARVGGYRGVGNVCDFGTGGFTTTLNAEAVRPPDSLTGQTSQSSFPRARWTPNVGANPLDLIRTFCRRDDWAFLPAGSNGGLPCTTTTRGASVDPGAVARELFGALSLPSLRLDMNPRLGLVAVPTWFWVEGYSGQVIPLSKTLTIPREQCTLVVDRDARGDPLLNSSGDPVVHQRCTTTFETIGVEVRAWPAVYHWDFGDRKEQTVLCHGVGACTAGLGRAYTDPHTPSPIQHAYRLSSLGQQGLVDAYGVQLGITFSAEYRFSRNGNVLGGWQGLPDRELSWAADHKVQEAQAILTRP